MFRSTLITLFVMTLMMGCIQVDRAWAPYDTNVNQPDVGGDTYGGGTYGGGLRPLTWRTVPQGDVGGDTFLSADTQVAEDAGDDVYGADSLVAADSMGVTDTEVAGNDTEPDTQITDTADTTQVVEDTAATDTTVADTATDTVTDTGVADTDIPADTQIADTSVAPDTEPSCLTPDVQATYDENSTLHLIDDCGGLDSVEYTANGSGFQVVLVWLEQTPSTLDLHFTKPNESADPPDYDGDDLRDDYFDRTVDAWGPGRANWGVNPVFTPSGLNPVVATYVFPPNVNNDYRVAVHYSMGDATDPQPAWAAVLVLYGGIRALRAQELVPGDMWWVGQFNPHNLLWTDGPATSASEVTPCYPTVDSGGEHLTPGCVTPGVAAP